MDSIVLALAINPYDARVIETDRCRARYVVSEPKGDVPALVWTFQITDDNNVVMTHVEECEGY